MIKTNKAEERRLWGSAIMFHSLSISYEFHSYWLPAAEGEGSQAFQASTHFPCRSIAVRMLIK